MTSDRLTPRERWLAVLRRETPDRLPMDYCATDEVTARLLHDLHCGDVAALYRHLHIDKLIWVGPEYHGPPPATGNDEFGCTWEYVEHPGGRYHECVGHPLAQYNSREEIEAAYRWPTPDDYDYAAAERQIAAYEDYPICGGGSEPFLRYTQLRGMEQAYRDLVKAPELVAYCLDKLFDLAYECTVRLHESFPARIDVSYVAEDLGAQDGLLFAPQVIREVLLPRMRRMTDMIHAAGAFVLCHSDGAIRPVISDVIAIGIDILNPVQWRCRGMEREGLRRDFGDAVIFHGGVDNQQTLAFGTPADVVHEVEENVRILGTNGGYIIAPCHNLQVISPTANIVALYEAGYASGRNFNSDA